MVLYVHTKWCAVCLNIYLLHVNSQVLFDWILQSERSNLIQFIASHNFLTVALFHSGSKFVFQSIFESSQARGQHIRDHLTHVVARHTSL